MTEAGKMKSHAESEIPAAVIVQDVIMEGVRISSDGRCGRRAFFDATDASNPAGGTGEAAADFANVRRLHNRPAHGQPAGGSYFIRFLTGGKEPCYNIGKQKKRSCGGEGGKSVSEGAFAGLIPSKRCRFFRILEDMRTVPLCGTVFF